MKKCARLTAAATLSLAALPVAACAPLVNVAPAPEANDPGCAQAMVYLPDTLSDLSRRETTSQATAAWGDPTGIVLRCGVKTPPAATPLPCVTANGVDWVAEEGADHWTLTTYGRTPAVEVLFNPGQVPSSNVLPELASSIQRIPVEAECLSTSQEVDLPTG